MGGAGLAGVAEQGRATSQSLRPGGFGPQHVSGHFGSAPAVPTTLFSLVGGPRRREGRDVVAQPVRLSLGEREGRAIGDPQWRLQRRVSGAGE